MTGYALWWIPLVSALAGSLITGGLVFVAEWYRLRRAATSAEAARKERAYAELLSSSMGVINVANGIQLAMRHRTGFRQGMSVTLWQRRNIEPFELVDWNAKYLDPLMRAWSDVWVVGSSRAVEGAEAIARNCMQVVNLAGRRGGARPYLRWLIGERYTADQLRELERAGEALHHARREFAEIARKETGREFVALV